MRKIKEPTTTYIVNKKGKKTAVILPIEEYERLMEDLADLAIIASRKDEPRTPWEEVGKKLKKDRLP